MKYIITGGAGFIGSHIVEQLVSQKKDVTVIDNLATGRMENLIGFLDKIKFVKGDILDAELMHGMVDKGDIILHQAALPSVIRSVKDPFLTNRVNVEGTLNVLLAARDKKAKRVVFASSSSVYGDTEVLPKAETMCPNPKSPYALSKLTAEYYAKLFYSLYGLETVGLRYFNVFGPRQDPNSQYSAAIPKFIRLMLENKPPVIFGDGNQTRDFTFVANVVEANLLAAVKDGIAGEIFNIAYGERVSLLYVIDEINRHLGKGIQPVFSEERKGEVKHSLASVEKAKRLMQYHPGTNFSDGLLLTINSLKLSAHTP